MQTADLESPIFTRCQPRGRRGGPRRGKYAKRTQFAPAAPGGGGPAAPNEPNSPASWPENGGRQKNKANSQAPTEPMAGGRGPVAPNKANFPGPDETVADSGGPRRQTNPISRLLGLKMRSPRKTKPIQPGSPPAVTVRSGEIRDPRLSIRKRAGGLETSPGMTNKANLPGVRAGAIFIATGSRDLLSMSHLKNCVCEPGGIRLRGRLLREP